MIPDQSLPTVSHPAGKAVWTSYGKAEIQASADVVWKAVRDLESYSKWNGYTHATSKSGNDIKVGDKITIHYRPEPKGSFQNVPCEVIQVSDEDMTVSWRGLPLPLFLLNPEKVQKVTPKGENSCLYEIWETQGGPVSYIVKWTLGTKLSAMNPGIAESLKKYVEDQKTTTEASA